LIDLHTHTTESDGTDSPERLVELAAGAGLEALAISDHDTLRGVDAAAEPARLAGLSLIPGIELSTRFRRHSAHLLGYFFRRPPDEAFRRRIAHLEATRRDRNRRLAARLRELGVEITLEEVESRAGRLAGRPHFARVMVEKGYVQGPREAFRLYLDETAPAYVERVSPGLAEAVAWILEAGGLPSLAHPVRLLRARAPEIESWVADMHALGLEGIEAYHHDHDREDIARFEALAVRTGLLVTGGSDYHGANKPGVRLGYAALGRLAIPSKILEEIRRRA
jgi:3',5'-nucleoside bisphosphate phosphatase